MATCDVNTLMAQAACFACLSSEAREVLKLQLLCAISSNVISGSGTINKIPKFTAANAIGNSNLSDDGVTVTNGGNLLNVGTLTVTAGSQFNSTATFSPSANSSAIISSGYSLTGNNAQSIVDISGTWNTTGTPTAVKVNVTDTASNAASLLQDWQVGGVSKVSISKAGQFTAASAINAFGGGSSLGNTTLQIANGTYIITVGSNVFSIPATTGYAITDTQIWRDAAYTLAQRNGTNAQSFRVYNTFTDASNYERGVFDWTTTANTLTIGAIAAGTGTVRPVVLTGKDTTVTATGNLVLGSSTAGAGATYFNSNNSTRWYLSLAGHFIPNADSSFDIGASGSGVRLLYLSKTVTTAGTTGAQTINKATGSVNFAAVATSLVVTNSLVTTSSVIVATVATNDTTMKTVSAVAAAGSFTLNANAAATAETRVNFVVLN